MAMDEFPGIDLVRTLFKHKKKRERKIRRRMFNHVVYKTFLRDFSRRSRSVVVKEMYQKAWRMSVSVLLNIPL